MTSKNLVYSRETEFTVLVDGKLSLCSYDLLRMACYPMTLQSHSGDQRRYVVRVAVVVDGVVKDVAEQTQAPARELILDLELAKYALLLRNEEEESAEEADPGTLEEVEDPKTVGVKLIFEAWVSGEVYTDQTVPTTEQLLKVYKHARGLCHGYNWEKGSAALIHRNKLLEAVHAIAPVPDVEGKKV